MSKGTFKPLPQGAYVLATKYSDGESGDGWAVGFIERDSVIEAKGRYHVVNNEGAPFRGNGFRRAEEITQAEGDHIISLKVGLDQNWSLCLWKVLAQFRGDIAPDEPLELYVCHSCKCPTEPGDGYCSTCGARLNVEQEAAQMGQTPQANKP